MDPIASVPFVDGITRHVFETPDGRPRQHFPFHVAGTVFPAGANAFCTSWRIPGYEGSMSMKIERGKPYRGPGAADPAKSRDQRAGELQAMSRTSWGQEVIKYYAMRYSVGESSGKVPPVGTLMIETILAHEYPQG